MNWLSKTLSSSLGKKLIMSLTGLFLILFLMIHLVGNLALLKNDNGLAFNAYAVFMTSNPLIKVVSYGLYLSILLHALYGLLLTLINRRARPVAYAVVRGVDNSTWASRNMMILGALVFAFIALHLKDFWWHYKFSGYAFSIDAEGNRDLYALVVQQLKVPFSMVSYLIGLAALGVHLSHGFQSAFQTMGLEHIKYTPFIKQLGMVYSIAMPLGFAIMPLYIYFIL